ncbi:hypothetical protein DFJ73DRAFT_775456 [Zopfochytrium polystomum]|nr:hypothetical protein DFJ73DRAFT_775456 [Zopfochytrium polystomum]
MADAADRRSVALRRRREKLRRSDGVRTPPKAALDHDKALQALRAPYVGKGQRRAEARDVVVGAVTVVSGIKLLNKHRNVSSPVQERLHVAGPKPLRRVVVVLV